LAFFGFFFFAIPLSIFLEHVAPEDMIGDFSNKKIARPTLFLDKRKVATLH